MAKFPDNTTSTCTIRGHQYVNAYTNTIRNLGLTDFPMDYFLGWIRPESLTELLKETFIALETNGGSTEVVAIPPEYNANIPVGYWFDTDSNLSAATSFLLHERTGNDSYSFTVTGGNSSRLINKFYPENFGMFRYCQFAFKYTLYTPPPDSSIVTVLSSVSFNVSNVVDAMNFLNGLASHTFTINYSGTSLKFTVNGSDFSTGTAIYTDDDNLGYQARFFFSSIGIDGMNAGENGTSNVNTCIAPMIKQTMAFHSTDSSQDYTRTVMYGNLQAGSSNQIAIVRYNSVGITELSYYDYANVRSRCGGISGKVSFSEEAVIDSNEKLLYNGGVILAKTDNNLQKYVYLYHPIDEAIKFINLFSKINKAAYQSYVNGITYAVGVDSNNEFLDEIKTGDILDETFRSGLLDWQYVPLDDDGTDQGTGKSDFDPTDPEDMPPYEPIPPTPGGEEGHNPDNPELSLGNTEDVPGDSVEPDEHRDSPIQFPVSAFMTQYVLTASDVYNMGRTLWSGMGDSLSQMASNFVKTYTSTGTINIANLMDFFVSVKCFPFDMTNIAYGWQAPAMTVGTGAVPILNSSVWVLGVSTYIVDCGTVATNIKPFTFGVNSNTYDFRNYVNCTISCFLPYCGTVELNPADVFPYTLSCKYFVDMLSGSCTAVIWAERPDGSVPVASKTGQIGKIVPISATNVMGVAGQAISGVSNIFQTVGEVVISAAKRRALGATQAPINEASKNKEYLQEMANYNKSQTDIGNKYSDAGSGLGVITGAVGGIGNLMTRNGVGIPSLGAGVGLEAMHISERPYIVIRRLNYSSPNNYAHTTGFSSTDGGGENNKSTIGAYSGWTVFQNVDLSGIYGTKEELEEIKMLLETGVYL